MSIFGINLCGAEFHVSNPAYPTLAQMQYYWWKNLRLIRVPFRWERIQPTLFGPLDQIELGKLKTCLTQLKVKMVPDLHNYGRYGWNSSTSPAIGSSAVPIAAFADVWGKLATELKGVSPYIYGYDIMNEPHDMGSPTIWPEAAQAASTAIRAVDQTTKLVVEGDGWSNASSWAPGGINESFGIDDPNWVPSTHSYWDNGQKGIYPIGQYGSYQSVKGWGPLMGVTTTQPYFDYLARMGHKTGYVGEFGVPGWPMAGDYHDASSNWIIVMNNFLQEIKARGIDATIWAGGNWQLAVAPPAVYPLSCEPQDGIDSPQVKCLAAQTQTN